MSISYLKINFYKNILINLKESVISHKKVHSNFHTSLQNKMLFAISQPCFITHSWAAQFSILLSTWLKYNFDFHILL